MATTPSKSPRILDLKPLITRRDGPAGGARSLRRAPDTPLSRGSFDFIDVVDDTPPASDGAKHHAPATRPILNRTWRVFLAMLAIGVIIGVLATPLVSIFNPEVRTEEVTSILFVTVLTGVLTGYLNYRLSRGMAGRLLQKLHEQSRTLFHLADPEPVHPFQASEIDRLDQTLAHLLGELKDQLDRQKRLERNDLIQTITSLATAIEARDPYTRNHSRSVARWTVRLGRAMGLKRDMLYEMYLAGLMHDIGKIGVPDEILLKPGRLTPEEVRAIQAHVEWSYSIISPITSLKQVSAIVRHHHERFDGKGYPDRLAGANIPLGARIMAVVDMFVAMTENRPYRDGLSVETAVAELRRVSGTQIDPTCMEAFLDILRDDGLLAPAGAAETEAQASGDAVESKRAAAN